MDRKKALASVLAGLCSISSSALAGGPGEKNILKRPRSQSVGGRPKMSSPSNIRGAIKAGDRKNRFDRSRLPVSRGSNSGSTKDKSSSTSSRNLDEKSVILAQNIPTSKIDDSLLKLLLTGGVALLLGGTGVGIPTYLITKKKNGSPLPLPGTPTADTFRNCQVAHALGFMSDANMIGSPVLNDEFFDYLDLLNALASLKFEANKDQMCITCKVKEGFPTTFQGVETPAAQIAKLKFNFAHKNTTLSIVSVVAPESFSYESLTWLLSDENFKTVMNDFCFSVTSKESFLGNGRLVLAEALFRSFMVSAGSDAETVNNMCKFNDRVCINLLVHTIN